MILSEIKDSIADGTYIVPVRWLALEFVRTYYANATVRRLPLPAVSFKPARRVKRLNAKQAESID